MLTMLDQRSPVVPAAAYGPRILVFEDDAGMRQMIVDYLRQNGMQAAGSTERQELQRHLATGELSLVMLDLRLGAHSGLDLLREIRADSDVPVIIVTGVGRDEIDRVLGLELGADDYITKPFSPRELLARIRAVMRRHEARPTEPRREKGRYGFSGWLLDRRLRRLTDPGGAEVRLTKGEYALLCAFLDSPGRPLSREQLLQATRVHEDIFDRSIDVQVLRLRRKLDAGREASMIRTERGVGYVFAVRRQRAPGAPPRMEEAGGEGWRERYIRPGEENAGCASARFGVADRKSKVLLSKEGRQQRDVA